MGFREKEKGDREGEERGWTHGCDSHRDMGDIDWADTLSGSNQIDRDT